MSHMNLCLSQRWFRLGSMRLGGSQEVMVDAASKSDFNLQGQGGGMEDWVLYRGRRKSLSRGAPPSQFEALAWMRGLISQKVL